MVWKKTWFSYLIWILFSAFTIGVLCFGMLGTYEKLEILMKPYFVGGSILAGIVLIVMFVLLGRRLSKRTATQEKNMPFVLEGILVVLLIGAGIFLRIFYGQWAEGSSVFFESSKVVAGQEIAPTIHGVTYLYQWLLKSVFLLFGNKWIVGIGLQCLLQLIAVLFFCLGVRKVAGAFPALSVLAVFMLSPTGIKTGTTYNTDMLFLCLYGIAFLGICSYLKKIYEQQKIGGFAVLGLVLLGLYAGFLAGMDVWAGSLVVFAISVAYVEAKESGKLAQISLFLISSFAGVVIYPILYGRLTGKILKTILEEINQFYQSTGLIEQHVLKEQLAGAEWLLAGLFLVIAAFVFVCRKKTEVLSGFWLVILMTGSLSVWQIAVLPSGTRGMFLWLIPVVAAVGIRELFKPWKLKEISLVEKAVPDTVYEQISEGEEENKEEMRKAKKFREEQRPVCNPALLADANEHMEKPKPSYVHPLMEDEGGRSGSYINTTSQPLPVRTQPIPDRSNIISEDSISMDLIEEPLLFQPIGEPILEQEQPVKAEEQIEETLHTETVTAENNSGITLVSPLEIVAASEFADTKTVEVPQPKLQAGSEQETEPVVQEAKPIHFIENPLPVPKKHVKKTMDFDFEPDESQMRFDCFVSNLDDYDLKE